MSEKAKKQDRRTRYTRQTIKDTFLELLKQKSFTKITVTEVCKNAEINRGTFYLHSLLQRSFRPLMWDREVRFPLQGAYRIRCPNW